MLVDYPLPERDDLPAVCVCDFHECDVRVAHVLACMIYSFSRWRPGEAWGK
jgi:hypothetical protein